MNRIVSTASLIFGAIFCSATLLAGESVAPACCTAESSFFHNEVWPKVGERVCLRCHHSNGDAQDTDFILERPVLGLLNQNGWMSSNQQMFEAMAKARDSSAERVTSRLLAKARGELDHGGGEVLKTDAAALAILERYTKLLEPSKSTAPLSEAEQSQAHQDLFRDVIFLSPSRTLRRLTLSLAGRLPTDHEILTVKAKGEDAIDGILDQVMQEDAFYERLKEGFNDIFLTIGIEDNAETLLSYHHFEKTRLWYQHWDFSHLPEAERQRAGWKLADVYREALLQEPLQLIEYIVRNNRPLSEILTADYIMVSPYTARGYGIFESIKDQFKDPENPFEFIPAKLPALVGRDGKVQESKTGLYPHAGLLSMFHYLRRYPSTETNRNRLRARMFYQHFLGVDIMQLAPRSTDATAVAAKYEVPTMQAADCVVCHRTIDPVASIFQDYDFEGHVIPRKEGWYEDMFQAGFEGEDMPIEERWRATQWLAERTVKDPRFAVAMVEHVYYILFGRKVLQLPSDIDDPHFLARRRAYLAQRRLIEEVSQQFIESNFDLKAAFRGLIESPFYKVDALQTVNINADRKVELDDLGLVRLLSPEQLERNIKAIFGKEWGRLRDETAILYGGIDSITVTERNADPSGAMGAIQRILANDLSCNHVANDFRRPATERLLFPSIEPEDVPGEQASNEKVLDTIIYLHQRVLGQEVTRDQPEVQRTYQLFCNVIQQAQASGFEKRETYFCGGREDFKTDDPHYTIRAWRAVMTYLLRQHAFLYE